MSEAQTIQFELVSPEEKLISEAVAMATIPGEEGDMSVYCSTQHPSEIQHKVARVLGVPNHAVTVETRRMGGAFGGKESQGNLPAAIAALTAKTTGRPAKIVYDRDDDFMLTGKRHDFSIDYDDENVLIGVTWNDGDVTTETFAEYEDYDTCIYHFHDNGRWWRIDQNYYKFKRLLEGKCK